MTLSSELRTSAQAKEVVLTGASSQLGQCLLPKLIQHGFHVRAWSRHAVPSESTAAVTWQRRDISQAGEALCAPVIVHLAPLWLLPALLDACSVQGGRIVAIGSCSISAKSTSPSARERDVAEQLRRAEQQLAFLAERDGHKLTILRPTMLYGVGMDGTIAPMQRFIRRWGFLPFPTIKFGLRQPVHVGDVADAVVACIGAPASIGRTYELGGGERLALNELARRLFTDNGRSARLLPVPGALLAILIRMRGLLTGDRQWDVALLGRAGQDQLADNAPARHDFNYDPRPFDGRFPGGR